MAKTFRKKALHTKSLSLKAIRWIYTIWVACCLFSFYRIYLYFPTAGLYAPAGNATWSTGMPSPLPGLSSILLMFVTDNAAINNGIVVGSLAIIIVALMFTLLRHAIRKNIQGGIVIALLLSLIINAMLIVIFEWFILLDFALMMMASPVLIPLMQ